MGWARTALGLVAVVAAGALLVSGGSAADPRTPAGLPGMPPPFLGVAVVGEGRLTAAVDAYGDVVDLRPRPAGRALIDNPSNRQAAGTVPADTGIVPWVSVEGRRARPFWTADSVQQAYRPGTNVLVTTARFGAARVRVAYAAGRSLLACTTEASGGARVSMRISEPAAERRLRCDDGRARRIVLAAERGDRGWLSGSAPLGEGAPPWARSLYRRSLLVLHILTDRRSGAVAAGARDGWAYVWPRDASAAAIALAAAGYREEAKRTAGFLLRLGLEDAARFHGDGTPVPGRSAQGDALGWVAAAARASGASRIGGSVGRARLIARLAALPRSLDWRNRADYQEGAPGDYLGNALAAGALGADNVHPHTADWTKALPCEGRSPTRLVRVPGDPASGLDSAAAWAVEPFSRPSLYAAARRTMLALVRRAGRFGITPGEAWPGEDPWSAPTAWTAWSLATLSQREAGRRSRTDRRAALHLLTDLRRAATPTGLLPERVDARSGVPRSTTPLAWSHAFAILALLELWPNRAPAKPSCIYFYPRQK
ncbi:MAG TPA: glycoside hydrolase family 15 protein [Solirubrobacterales bacterium]|nr:glycoside hydrolase family 15 protein [Solirubrobacterales bacterium]